MLGGPETQARKSIWFEMKYIQIQVCHLCSHHKLGLVNKFERKMKWKKKKLRDWKGLSFRNASLELSILSMTLCIYWSFGVKECNKELHFWFSWWIWENISKLVIELTNLENRNGKTFFRTFVIPRDGLREAVVKSVKHHIKRVVRSSNVIEEWSTVLSQEWTNTTNFWTTTG